MKERNNEKIIHITVIFCVILSGIWGVNRYIDSLKYTIQQLKDTNIQSEQREQKLIRDVQSAKDTNRQLNNRNKQLERNNIETSNTIDRLQQRNRELQNINIESEKRVGKLKDTNKQLSDRITKISTGFNKTSTDFNEFRKGLERQSGYIEELSKTITEIERNDKSETK